MLLRWQVHAVEGRPQGLQEHGAASGVGGEQPDVGASLGSIQDARFVAHVRIGNAELQGHRCSVDGSCLTDECGRSTAERPLDGHGPLRLEVGHEVRQCGKPPLARGSE